MVMGAISYQIDGKYQYSRLAHQLGHSLPRLTSEAGDAARPCRVAKRPVARDQQGYACDRLPCISKRPNTFFLG